MKLKRTKLVAALFCCLFFITHLQGAQKKKSLTTEPIDCNVTGVHFDHYWSNCVGAGRANEGLRAGWLEQLQLVKDNCGFKYCRFHGLFHDDMFPYFEKNGKVVYNWQYIDELFDRILQIGVKPFVELAFFPKDIAAKNGKTQFWWKANISVDRNNFGKWHNLVKAFTDHVIARYGIDEVLTWYFEVWNEPNLNPGFLDGTKSDYFQLYKESVLAVKSVDKRLKVGGPSTSNFVADERYKGEIYDKNKSVFYNKNEINKKLWKSPWMEEFLAYCAKENLPLDFVSTHPYPTDYALDPGTGLAKNATRYVNATKDDLTWLRGVLAKSNYPNAEIHLTEWSSSPSSRDVNHDLLHVAAYILKVNLDCIGLANSLSYWTFTDIFEEKGGGETIFHGSFGMINYQGFVKPSYHAYRMLNQLGDEILQKVDGSVITRNSKTNKISAIYYNYPAEMKDQIPNRGYAELDSKIYDTMSSKTVTLSLKNLPPNARFEIEILDREHGNVVKAWKDMGAPEPPTREQSAELKRMANKTDKITIEADSQGNLEWKHTISPWACVLIVQK